MPAEPEPTIKTSVLGMVSTCDGWVLWVVGEIREEGLAVPMDYGADGLWCRWTMVPMDYELVVQNPRWFV